MSTNLMVSLDHVHVNDDHDGCTRGAGEIYFHVNIDGGFGNDVDETTSTYSIDSGDGDVLNENFEITAGDALNITISAWDDDWPDGDDHLVDDLIVHFTDDENFGIGQQQHTTEDYILTYTIFAV